MRSCACRGTVFVILSGVLLLGNTACAGKVASSKSDAGGAAEVPVSAPAAPVPQTSGSNQTSDRPLKQPDPYKLALNKADSARNITQSAQSQDDWNLVVSQWQQAIQWIRSVPASSPLRTQSQAKLAEYQRNLIMAKKQASRAAAIEATDDPTQVEVPMIAKGKRVQPSLIGEAARVARVNPSSSQANQIFQARIKRRAGGTPVIDVTFNGSQTFEMIVDTGASSTVITSQMAKSLNVQVVGSTKVDTASDKGVEVSLAQVDSIAIGGIQMSSLVVAIGGPALEIGLLGHDFFGNYDVTVKRDVVEFKQRS